MPDNITVRDALTWFIDLQGMLRNSTFKRLLEVVKNPEHKRLLKELSDSKTIKELQARKWGLIDLLENYSIEISMNDLVEVSNRVVSRFYTIASSPRIRPTMASILISLTIDPNTKPTPKYGLASGYLDELYEKYLKSVKCCARLKFTPSLLKMPTEENTPVLCIGTGAGFAPFKGILDEKAWCVDNIEDSRFGEISLVFGFRNKNEDYLYKEEIESWKNRGIINNLLLAVSRDSSVPKEYVQDVLEKNPHLVIDTLNNKGRIYICGNLKMSQAVRDVIQKILMNSYMLGDMESAKDLYESLMHKEGRIGVEAFG